MELAAHLFQVDGEVAHQPFDHMAVHAIVERQGKAARRCQISRLNCGAPDGDRNLVLHIALRQRANGRGAQPDQRRRGVGGIALEVARQCAFPRCQRHGVIGAGIVIQPNRHIAGRAQKVMDQGFLFQPSGHVG